MSLLSDLDDAELVVSDEDLGVMFVWFGGPGVRIFNERGDVIDYFSISSAFARKLTVPEVRKVIAAYRDEMMSEDES
jgi:hypothetical protein